MRQAALGAVLGLLGEVEHGVDQVADLALDVPGEDPQPDADLRRGQAGAGRLEHRVGEVLDEPAQLLVEVDDLDRRLRRTGSPNRRMGWMATGLLASR